MASLPPPPCIAYAVIFAFASMHACRSVWPFPQTAQNLEMMHVHICVVVRVCFCLCMHTESDVYCIFPHQINGDVICNSFDLIWYLKKSWGLMPKWEFVGRGQAQLLWCVQLLLCTQPSALCSGLVIVALVLCLPCPALQEQLVRRRGRRPKLDPRTLDAQRLTGEENVSVIERGSGRKVRCVRGSIRVGGGGVACWLAASTQQVVLCSTC